MITPQDTVVALLIGLIRVRRLHLGPVSLVTDWRKSLGVAALALLLGFGIFVTLNIFDQRARTDTDAKNETALCRFC